MKKLLIFGCLLFLGGYADIQKSYSASKVATKVFVVEKSYDADIKVFVVEDEYNCDLKVFKVFSEYNNLINRYT